MTRGADGRSGGSLFSIRCNAMEFWSMSVGTPLKEGQLVQWVLAGIENEAALKSPLPSMLGGGLVRLTHRTRGGTDASIGDHTPAH